MTAPPPGPVSRARTPRELGTTFAMTGMLGDAVVTASFARGRLECDPRLLTVAALLVDLAERFEDDDEGVAASVGADPLATLLTLMRACDQIVTVDVVLV